MFHPCNTFVRVTALALSSLVGASAAHAQTFSNTTPITIQPLGIATPYPSIIEISGVSNPALTFSVTLNNFSHTFLADVHVLLVGPAGQSILLLANAGGGGDAINADLTFSSDATTTISDGNVGAPTGTFAPSVYSPVNLPAGAPAGPYGNSLLPLVGTSVNGTWRLFVWDDAPQDSGAIAEGWSVRIVQLPTTAMTYQGVLTSGGDPINGDANVRFTLTNDPMLSLADSAVAPGITRNFAGVQGGLITTSLDFGPVVDTLQARWLNIEVESPPGSGFVTLMPRQAMTPVPQARAARTAVTASNALNVSEVRWSSLTTGNAVFPTGSRLFFGTESENTDPFYLERSNNNSDITELRLIIGDNSTGALIDAFRIARIVPGAGIVTTHVFGSDGSAFKPGGGSWAAISDPRAKHDIAPLTGTLDKLLSLRGYTFQYNKDRIESGLALPGTQIGLMADEVERVFPDWVSTDTSGLRYVSERGLSALMVEALRDLRAEKDAVAASAAAAEREIAELKADVARRDAEIDDLKARLEAIEGAMKPTDRGEE